MRPHHLILIALLALPATSEGVEFGLSQVSLNAGFAEHFYRDAPETPDIYAFFPELQVRGPLLTSYLHWVLAWGYWDDGIEKPFTEDNDLTYSFRDQTLAARLMFRPRKTGDNWPLPIGVFAGYSHHRIRAEYVGGVDDLGHPGRDADRTSNTFEFGLNIEFPFRGPFVLRGEVRQYAPVSGDDFDQPQKNRRAYTIGLGYNL